MARTRGVLSLVTKSSSASSSRPRATRQEKGKGKATSSGNEEESEARKKKKKIIYESTIAARGRHLFDILAPGETTLNIPQPVSTAGATTSGTAAPTTLAPPPTFVFETRDAVQEIGSSEDEEEAESRSDDEKESSASE
ncbi:unnamed protein product [Ilex paraguariensis]|uniref:Uncharacterized protein n=1 Tax=Ilex paraguariensis TaxID=185542 RepID=A0ABC8S8L3_9AQUA